MISGLSSLPSRPLAVFRGVVATDVQPISATTRADFRPIEQSSRLVAYGRTDGLAAAIRRVKTAAHGVGEHHPHSAITFSAHERIGEDGSLLTGSWRGSAVGQLITSGQYSELVSWHYDLEEDEITDQVRTTKVTIPTAGKKPRVGLIGAGAFAWNVVIPALRFAGAQVVAVADASRLRSAALAFAAKVPAVADPPSALLQPGLELDGVVIACAHGAHASYACRALRCGYDVLVEKPAAMNADELCRLVDAARSSGRGLYVGHNRRYARGFEDLVSAASGAEPCYLYAGVEAYPLGPLHWYRAPDQGGRVLGNLTHWIDLAIGVHGDRFPAEIRAAPMVGEGVGVDLRFPGGSLAELRLLDVGRRTVSGRETITLVAPRISMRIDDWRRVVSETSVKRKVARGSRSRGHTGSYGEWVESLVAKQRGKDKWIAELVRSHSVAFRVLDQMKAGDETWCAFDGPTRDQTTGEGV